MLKWSAPLWCSTYHDRRLELQVQNLIKQVQCIKSGIPIPPPPPVGTTQVKTEVKLDHRQTHTPLPTILITISYTTVLLQQWTGSEIFHQIHFLPHQRKNIFGEQNHCPINIERDHPKNKTKKIKCSLRFHWLADWFQIKCCARYS